MVIPEFGGPSNINEVHEAEEIESSFKIVKETTASFEEVQDIAPEKVNSLDL